MVENVSTSSSVESVGIGFFRPKKNVKYAAIWVVATFAEELILDVLRRPRAYDLDSGGVERKFILV